MAIQCGLTGSFLTIPNSYTTISISNRREEEEGEGAIEVTAREGPLREEEVEGARVLVQMP